MTGRDSLAGEVALVTGASRGLGLLLARELARRSAKLVICARDAGELERAEAGLRDRGADVAAVACDVAGEATPDLLIQTALDRFGKLDMLVSNAGIITVAGIEGTTAADFQTAVEVMTLAPVRLTLAALEVMRKQDHGRIVTIASVGGKVSVPRLLPYSVAKFGELAFSEGLRAELGPGPITVTTVVPGLMRTGSHEHARFGGRPASEYTWFSLAASLPVVSMDAERAARRIISAAAAGQPELILTPLAQVAARGAALSPALTSSLLHLTHRLLPSTGGERRMVPGQQLRPVLDERVFSWLTSLGRAAARRFNQ
ncbi:MAG TPA: SDR family oxidoreductase [Streptosporangiaceae bacterium]|jgi:NAD(P)-dependent dehydrogenase (short-subunit alcohol dehydrogenase family)|nr:SDR family oxidoreductase [Streptosporangiaceae bacterium]